MKRYQKAESKDRASNGALRVIPTETPRRGVPAKDVKLTPIEDLQRLGLAADPLEELVREGARQMLRAALAEEVEEYLARGRYERSGEFRGYRNGYGKERSVTIGSGTLRLRVPRVSHAPEGQVPFESKYLASYQRRSPTVRQLFSKLFIEGLATRDFEPALRCLLGEEAALSPATVSRLNAKFKAEYEAWLKQKLGDLRMVYAWADGIYLKAGVGKERAALLIIIGADTDGRKRLLALREGYRESTDSWKEVLKDLRDRGLRAPALLCGDGNLGLWGAAAELWPDTLGQRCLNHKLVNLLDKLPRRMHEEVRQQWRGMYLAESEEAARQLAQAMIAQWQPMYPRAAECLLKDLDTLMTYWKFPIEHHRHLRTTNVIESPFATVRLRTNAAKRFRIVRSGVHWIHQVLQRAEQNWKRLSHPEKLRAVPLPDEKKKERSKKKAA